MSVMWLLVGGIVGYILGGIFRGIAIRSRDHYCPHCSKQIYFTD